MKGYGYADAAAIGGGVDAAGTTMTVIVEPDPDVDGQWLATLNGDHVTSGATRADALYAMWNLLTVLGWAE